MGETAVTPARNRFCLGRALSLTRILLIVRVQAIQFCTGDDGLDRGRSRRGRRRRSSIIVILKTNVCISGVSNFGEG